jgi:hypothetical protein
MVVYNMIPVYVEYAKFNIHKTSEEHKEEEREIIASRLWQPRRL